MLGGEPRALRRLIARVVGRRAPAVPTRARCSRERDAAVGAERGGARCGVRCIRAEILRDGQALVAIHLHRDREHCAGIERADDACRGHLLQGRAVRNALIDLLVAERAVLGVNGGAGRRRGDLCLGYVGAEQALAEIEQRLPREDVERADRAFADEHAEQETAERDPHDAADVTDEIRRHDRQEAPSRHDRRRIALQRRANSRRVPRVLALEVLAELERPCEGVDARRGNHDADQRQHEQRHGRKDRDRQHDQVRDRDQREAAQRAEQQIDGIRNPGRRRGEHGDLRAPRSRVAVIKEGECRNEQHPHAKAQWVRRRGARFLGHSGRAVDRGGAQFSVSCAAAGPTPPDAQRIASGRSGEPVAPWKRIGVATNRNS